MCFKGVNWMKIVWRWIVEMLFRNGSKDQSEWIKKIEEGSSSNKDHLESLKTFVMIIDLKNPSISNKSLIFKKFKLPYFFRYFSLKLLQENQGRWLSGFKF